VSLVRQRDMSPSEIRVERCHRCRDARRVASEVLLVHITVGTNAERHDPTRPKQRRPCNKREAAGHPTRLDVVLGATVAIRALRGAAAQPAEPTITDSANQQMTDGPAVADLPVAGINARQVYSANGERIGELSEILLDDARRPIAASIETDEATEGTGGREHIVGADKLRLKGSRLVTNLTRREVEAMPRAND
jgi:hypothetical protein